MIPLAAGLFGLIIGSFLNVVILRRGVRDIGGRSACSSCGHTLAWYDLVPLFSWVALRAKCRYCGSAISWQYPLVEAITGMLFALSVGAPQLQIASAIAGGVLIAIALCIVVYDFRHTIIPDAWTVLFALTAMVYVLARSGITQESVWQIVLGAVVATLPLALLWGVSRGAWMGFGDVKLALGIGALLGPLAGLFAVFAAFVLGSVVLVPLLLWEKVTHMPDTMEGSAGLTMKSEVPFGPFLIASTLIVWMLALYGYNLPALVGW